VFADCKRAEKQASELSNAFVICKVLALPERNTHARHARRLRVHDESFFVRPQGLTRHDIPGNPDIPERATHIAASFLSQAVVRLEPTLALDRLVRVRDISLRYGLATFSRKMSYTVVLFS